MDKLPGSAYTRSSALFYNTRLVILLHNTTAVQGAATHVDPGLRAPICYTLTGGKQRLTAHEKSIFESLN